MEAVMRLYEFGPTRSIRARWTLQELGVGFAGGWIPAGRPA